MRFRLWQTASAIADASEDTACWLPSAPGDDVLSSEDMMSRVSLRFAGVRFSKAHVSTFERRVSHAAHARMRVAHLVL